MKTAGFPDVEGVRDVNKAKVVLFKNTMEMEVMYVSECLVPELKNREKIQIIGKPMQLPFNAKGNLAIDFDLG